MKPLLARTRLEREHEEDVLLSPAAARSGAGRGREVAEQPDPYRTAFERDRDRIIHSKAFRRLKHKTQVFINPDDDHFVTRLTHTLNVTQIGRSLARSLRLNEDLTEAICLGHDVGHPPFGHIGEVALSPYVDGEWLHSLQALRIFAVLEPANLTWEVRDGIRAHTWRIEPPPATEEGMVCRFADRIAYLTHDVIDAIRAGVITDADLPAGAVDVFGEPGPAWVGAMVEAVIEHSAAEGSVAMDPGVLAVMHEVRDFMFERVYDRPAAAAQHDQAIRVIRDLVDYFLARPGELPESFRHDEAPPDVRAIDYVAGMTDRFALTTHRDLCGGRGDLY